MEDSPDYYSVYPVQQVQDAKGTVFNSVTRVDPNVYLQLLRKIYGLRYGSLSNSARAALSPQTLYEQLDALNTTTDLPITEYVRNATSRVEYVHTQGKDEVFVESGFSKAIRNIQAPEWLTNGLSEAGSDADNFLLRIMRANRTRQNKHQASGDVATQSH